MVRGIAAVLMVGVTLGVAMPAFAVEGKPYASMTTGVTFLNDSDLSYPEERGSVDFETGYNLGAALGYDFGPGRVEVEIAYRDNEANRLTRQGTTTEVDGNFSALSFMVNGYYDFRNRSIVTPFVTAGLGYANVDAEDFDDHTVFAYQVGAGVGIALNKQVSLDLGYKYFATDDPEFDEVEAEYSSHNLIAGLRFSF